MATIKPEPMDTDDNSIIKAEPKTEAFSDDEYEDAGDLELAQGTRGVWLVKIPRFIMEKWETIEDDEEIVLGHVWVKSDPSGGQKLKCVLNSDAKCNENLPLDYDMNVTNMSVTNTFVFSEKDMPGFTKDGVKKEGGGTNGVQTKSGAAGAGKKDQSQRHNHHNQKFRKDRQQPFIRRAIPKQTALIGTVKHEATLLPIHTKAYTQLMSERTTAVLKPKHKIQYIDRVINPNLQAPGTVGSAGVSGSGFTDFIKHDKGIKKPLDGKTTRMPRNELVDALFRCFQQYTAWSIKGLREHLAQPESYLKEILSEIAILHRSGKFAQKYTLKPEYTQQSAMEGQESAGAAAGSSSVSGGDATGGVATAPGEVIDIEEDEELDAEMEDVL